MDANKGFGLSFFWGIVAAVCSAILTGCSPPAAADAGTDAGWTDVTADGGEDARADVPVIPDVPQMPDAVVMPDSGHRACATNADCADTDACTVNERCDPATDLCQFDLLDRDHDGYPPSICVMTGGDCDDSNPNIHPGAMEICNGVDDNCNGLVDEGIDLMTDPANCGSCGIRCGTPYYGCVGGSCACVMPVVCGVCGLDLMTNDANCGSCGNSCGPGHCSVGVCVCPSGTTLCSGTCVDTGTDARNCGGCGIACAAGAPCAAGVCGCPPGQRLCGATCISMTDPHNCGGCGVDCGSCGGTGSCYMNACVYTGTTCSDGHPFTSCGRYLTCLADDPNNCGACSHICPGGTHCCHGSCI